MLLPASRGPLSASLIARLSLPPQPLGLLPDFAECAVDDDDLHLALALCYELSGGGIAGVDDDWEWEPSLVAFRRQLENRFEYALCRAVARRPAPRDARDVATALRTLIDRDPAPSLSSYMAERATPEQFRELVVHRSWYQLREADPHTWAIPRLRGEAKAALVMVQADEYGGGVYEQMHSSLYRHTMEAFELDTTEGAYLDAIPGITLATVNLMNMFGMHRKWRGAITGHLAVFEMTSTTPNRRYGDGLRRLGFGPDATRFYDEHVTADAVHEKIACELACAVAAESPSIASGVLFGAETLLHLEGLFASRLLDAWGRGASSLAAPLERAA